MRTIPGLLTASAITAAGLLAGCGSAPAAHPAATHAAAVPASGYAAGAANPVPILRLTGCPVPASEVSGAIGADDNRDASCTWPGTGQAGGEEVFVFTYADTAYRDNRAAHPLTPPADGEYVIKGPDASLVVVDRNPGDTGPTVQQIAARVHGTVLAAP